MFYSLIQQVIHTDPLVYGINVALQGDRNHRLVSCAYGTKYAASAKDQLLTGDLTGSLHMDANIVALVEHGINKNMLTCGISLDNEAKDNCTIVVPGTHLHSARTLETLREADAANTNDVTTTDFGKTWKRLLTQKFGDLISVPCKRFGARISKVAIVHGSTALATRTRRVIFPWYLGYNIHYDHSDIPHTHMWLEHQRNHSECIPRTLGPSGKRPTTALPRVLPWSVPMTFCHALGRACLARKKYKDPSVQAELDQLFSPNLQVHPRFVEKARKEALIVMKETWILVQELEKRAALDVKDSFLESSC
jgi:hypothetical protein